MLLPVSRQINQPDSGLMNVTSIGMRVLSFDHQAAGN
jgi:hypothetical protein